MSKRLVFTFDERAYEDLVRLTEEGKYSSMAEAVRQSLGVLRALEQQARQGYQEIIVRNPKTDEQRVMAWK